jgi:hypothetical protein
MLLYSIILFAVAALLFAVGASIHRGNTKLIHDYHQENVKESERGAYGRAFAKGIFALCVSFALSGILALFGESGAAFSASLFVLFAGVIVSSVILIRVQKKYNGGIF